jgi:hypothetical protein
MDPEGDQADALLHAPIMGPTCDSACDLGSEGLDPGEGRFQGRLDAAE